LDIDCPRTAIGMSIQGSPMKLCIELRESPIALADAKIALTSAEDSSPTKDKPTRLTEQSILFCSQFPPYGNNVFSGRRTCRCLF